LIQANGNAAQKSPLESMFLIQANGNAAQPRRLLRRTHRARSTQGPGRRTRKSGPAAPLPSSDPDRLARVPADDVEESVSPKKLSAFWLSGWAQGHNVATPNGFIPNQFTLKIAFSPNRGSRGLCSSLAG